MAEILVVDDDQSVASAFERFLHYEGYRYRIASNAQDALRLMDDHTPDLVVMDVRMPGVDGLQALQEMRARFPDVYVVMMTAYGTSQTSIDAIRAGAFDYLTKPLDLDQLRTVIQKALAARRIRDAAHIPSDSGPTLPAVSLVGDTPAMHDVYKTIGRLATNDVPALVIGERGTGKQLVVATIHDNSDRREKPFVSLDCAALPESIVEQELFGRSAGTVHLANVQALPPALQARLARALGPERTRGSAAGGVDARVLASTDSDLARLVADGTFNHELFDALAVITVRLPPLRERREDIPLLVTHLVQRFNEELNRTIKGVDEELSRRLQAHEWPGNVGELESVVKRACIITRGDVLTIEDIGDSLTASRFPVSKDVEGQLARAVRTTLQERLVEPAGASPSSIFHDIVDLVEATLVKEALTITNGNQVKAAEILGVNRATLRKKMPSNAS
jgi:DNA-binding NtrC family response regulator